MTGGCRSSSRLRAPRPTSRTASTRPRALGGSSRSRGPRRSRACCATPMPTRTPPTWRAKVQPMPALVERRPAPGADRGDQGARTQPCRAAVRAVAGADGDWRRQDLHRGDPVVPAAQARRVSPGAVPGRPQQPRRPDAARVPELRHAGRRPPVHRAVQRRQAHRRRHGRLVARRHLDDPAGVRGAARPAGCRRRRPGPRRLHPRPARSRSPTTRSCRRRRSIW